MLALYVCVCVCVCVCVYVSACSREKHRLHYPGPLRLNQPPYLQMDQVILVLKSFIFRCVYLTEYFSCVEVV